MTSLFRGGQFGPVWANRPVGHSHAARRLHYSFLPFVVGLQHAAHRRAASAHKNANIKIAWLSAVARRTVLEGSR